MTAGADRRHGAERAQEARGHEWHEPVFVISLAAQLADMHPQTLRQYDRLGLVVPQRQGGRHRRYSRADVDRLRTIQGLSREGVSLEGIRRIVALQREVEQLQDTVVELASQVDRLHQASRLARVFSVGAAGDVSTRYADDARTSTARSRAERAGVVDDVRGEVREAGVGTGDVAGARRSGALRALAPSGLRPLRVLTWSPPHRG